MPQLWTQHQSPQFTQNQLMIVKNLRDWFVSFMAYSQEREKQNNCIFYAKKNISFRDICKKKCFFPTIYSPYNSHFDKNLYAFLSPILWKYYKLWYSGKKKKRISKSEPVDLPDCQDKIERSPHSQSLSSTKLDVAGGSSLPIFVTSPILSDVCDGVPLSRAVLWYHCTRHKHLPYRWGAKPLPTLFTTARNKLRIRVLLFRKQIFS